MLMQDFFELKDEFDKSEERKNELENQIEIMRTELLKAQKSLSRLEQFETEKNRLKEDLESKIEEFNILTEHYQHEKESYLGVLEHIQDQVNIYRNKSQQFGADKGSWSKQIDEMKAELSQTKIALAEMVEIKQKSEQLTAELQSREIEIYKMKKENERLIEQQMDQFKLELKKYQDKIVQYEKDREIWEKQMKQMKAQCAGLESNLEERENFIKQYIKQPPSEMKIETESSSQNFPQMEQAMGELSSESNQPIPQQPGDWFHRVISEQQGNNKPAPSKRKSSNFSTMDFFTLRNKTNQSAIPGPIYGSQWNEE